MFWKFFWWLFTPVGQMAALTILIVFIAALITFSYLLWRYEHGK